MRTRILFCICCAPLLLRAQASLTTTVSQRYFTTVRWNLEAAAEVMPADKYGFKLTSGQMSFAEWIHHSIEDNYADCAVLKGEPVPDAAKRVTDLKEKAAVRQALKESFDYCAAALDGIDDRKVLASAQMTNSLLHLAVHNNEVYGNLVGYLRVSGIVPPSTARRAEQKGGKQ
jgi:DinB superfamily